MRHIHRIQIADGYLRGGRVEKELVLRERDRFLRRVYDSLGACLQCRFKKGYYLRWLTCQPMRQLFVVGDEMCNVNVAVVLLNKNIFSYLISVDKNVVEVKLHYEINERLLNP